MRDVWEDLSDAELVGRLVRRVGLRFYMADAVVARRDEPHIAERIDQWLNGSEEN